MRLYCTVRVRGAVWAVDASGVNKLWVGWWWLVVGGGGSLVTSWWCWVGGNGGWAEQTDWEFSWLQADQIWKTLLSSSVSEEGLGAITQFSHYCPIERGGDMEMES